MNSFSTEDEKIALDDFVAPIAVETPANDEKRGRGRPKKSDVAELTVAEIKAEVHHAEITEAKERKAMPALDVWQETNGRKIIECTRTAQGNVYRKYVGLAAKKKKGK